MLERSVLLSVSEKGTRGLAAQDAVEELFEAQSLVSEKLRFIRLPDAKSAGGRFPAQLCDFLVFIGGKTYAVEVKETKELNIMLRGKFVQYARMKRVVSAGVVSLLVVHHSLTKVWRAIRVQDLNLYGGFRLNEFSEHKNEKEALSQFMELV